MEAGFRDPVNPRAMARVANGTLVRLNHEIYFFSDPRTRGKFEEKPWKWCGRVTDPVSLERFEPRKRSPSLVVDGQRFYFASDSTRAVFAADPEPWRAPRDRMAEMAAGSTAAADSTGG
jgi:YHS domain-containing protein